MRTKTTKNPIYREDCCLERLNHPHCVFFSNIDRKLAQRELAILLETMANDERKTGQGDAFLDLERRNL